MGMRQRRGPAAASYPPLRLVLLVCACVEPLCAEPEPRAPLDDFSFIAPYDDINPFTGERLFSYPLALNLWSSHVRWEGRGSLLCSSPHACLAPLLSQASA